MSIRKPRPAQIKPETTSATPAVDPEVANRPPLKVATPWEKHVPEDIAQRFEIHDFRHASSILASEFPDHLKEVCDALREFYFTDTEVRSPGGNESVVPKRLADLLRPKNWKEKNLQSKLVYVDPDTNKEVAHSSDTHKVDYCKGRVALDLEWNSKDQTFDRDLFAFRTFNEIGMISVGIIVTRSNQLDGYFVSLGPALTKDGSEHPENLTKDKFGASTTHMGKLIPRIEAGRGGGCPLLVFGITPQSRRDESTGGNTSKAISISKTKK